MTAAALGGQLVAAVREQPQHGAVVVRRDPREVIAVLGDHGDAEGVDAVALAAVTAFEHPGPGSHQQIADRTDVDLAGETRWAAMWQMAGRCIGYARALLVLAHHAGFGDEAPSDRSLVARGRPPARRTR